MKLPPLWQQCLVFWALLCLIVIFYTDFGLPALVHQSDYLMTFHCAGYIAAHGLWGSLYPGADAVSFAGQAFDRQAHTLLAQMPTWSEAEYMYMPLSAFVFAPFSFLPLSVSLMAWQLTSMASLYVGNLLIVGRPGRAFLASCAAFLFIPAVFTLWIGQVGLVFGMLPLAAGFFLIKNKRYLAAGFALALLSLKPQMLLPALFMLAFTLAIKKYRTAIGMVAGGAIIALLNLLPGGIDLCRSWLGCLALSDKVYTEAAHVAVQLATSLPRAILLSQPPATQAAIKLPLYGFSALLLITGLFTVFKISKLSIPSSAKLNYSFILGSLGLPSIVPHLFLYDLGALVGAASLLFFTPRADGETAESYDRPLRRIFITLWLCITLYCVALMANKALASPLLLVAIMLALYLRALALFAKKILMSGWPTDCQAADKKNRQWHDNSN